MIGKTKYLNHLGTEINCRCEHGDGSSVHYSLICLEYIEISCNFASEIKPYLYAKECENEKQDGHLPCNASWHQPPGYIRG